MSFESLLNKTVNVESRVESQNAMGEVSNAWSVLHANMPCRIQPNKVSERNNTSGEYFVAPFTIYALTSYAIADDDRIVDVSTVYEVIRASKDSSDHHWQLQCKVIDN